MVRAIQSIVLTFFMSVLSAKGLQPLLGISVGPAWYQAGQTQNIALQPNYFNTYVAQKPTQALVIGDLFLGIQREIGKNHGQLGLSLGTTNSAQLKGHIWETGNAQFDNYTYHYRIKHTHVMLKGRYLWDIIPKYALSPYVSAGVGVAQNTSYHFSMSPLIYEALAVPGFQNHRTRPVSYSVGAGLYKWFLTNFQAGFGYQLNSWGSSNLARAPGQTVNTGLNLANLYAHQLELSLNYIF